MITLSACTVFSTGAEVVTPTPMPTSSVEGYQVISSQACQIAQQGMIRVEHPQGDLISWSPLVDTVAYIASTLNSSWNVGNLNILSAPSFDTPERIATQAAGELTWSPDGTSIAYLGLRLSDNIYTIGLAYPDGRPSTDLFPGEAARTDGFASQKAILEWSSTSRLSVLTSCGVNCFQELDFSIPGGFSAPTTGTSAQSWDLWSVHTHHPTQIPPAYADLTGQLNWSPDEQRIAYIDGNGYVWIVIAETETLYPLDIGAYATATETDWSFDSRYLAVHVDQSLKIFSFECP